MKFFAKMMAAVMALAICVTGVAMAEGKITTTESMNVRTGAGLDYAKQGAVGKGETLTFDKTSKDERGVTWYHVSLKKGDGWVSSKYAKEVTGKETAKVDNSQKVLATAKVTIRTGAGLSYKAIGAMDKADVAVYQNESVKDERGVVWHKVKMGKKEGWVSSKYSQIGLETKKSVKVTGSKVNLRNAAGLSAKSVGALTKNDKVFYLGKTMTDERGVDWYKVGCGNSFGWVSSAYAKLGK